MRNLERILCGSSFYSGYRKNVFLTIQLAQLWLANWTSNQPIKSGLTKLLKTITTQPITKLSPSFMCVCVSFISFWIKVSLARLSTFCQLSCQNFLSTFWLSTFSGGACTSAGDTWCYNIPCHYGTDSGKMATISLSSRRWLVIMTLMTAVKLRVEDSGIYH